MTKALTASVIGLFLLFSGAILFWHRLDTRPPAWDESVHLHLALDYKARLLHGTPFTSPWAAEYPPLYHLSLIPALSAGLPSETKAALMHTFYLIFLVGGLVMLARGMGRPAEDGLLAALLVIGCAHVFYTDRRALIDFPLLCWVTFGMALLQRTERLVRRGWTFLWAVWSGLGLLLKFFYPIFFVFPCVLMLLFKSSRRPARRAASPWRNFLGALVVIAAIALPWYGWQGLLFLRQAVGIAGAQGAVEGDPAFTTWAGWWYYLHGLLIQMGSWSLLFAAAGVAWLFLRWRESRGKGLLIAWILSGYIGFSFVHNKDWRYTLPYLPALALLSIVGWFPAEPGRSRRLFVPILLGLFAYNAVAYDPPRREDWKHAEIGNFMESHRDPTQPFLIASVLSNHSSFFGRNLRWTMRAQGQPLTTQSPGDPTADFVEFIITKSGDLGPSAEDLQKEWARLETSGRSFQALYPQVATFPLPDGSQATIYQRDARHMFQVGPVTPAELEKRLAALLERQVQGPVQVSVEGTPEGLPRGRLDRLRIVAGPCTVRGVPIERLDVTLTQVWLNLYQVWDHQALGLLAFSSIEPHVEVRAPALQMLAMDQVKDLLSAHLRFEDGRAQAEAVIHHLLLSADADARIEKNPPRLVARVLTLHVDGLPLPGWLFGKIHLQELPLDPIPSFPGALRVHHVTLDHDTLQVS